ncbi:hypothetical protein PUNSTDRAFT_118585 [Punctularia strigosozonata HHB-11173 SS5]|uniref:uncharacterized protein n=1 Tax=Punctularia strigosozonata (strain HHB-11173) TaxID=741275 RepID=UPI00044170AE|nr:uncharacterized protein PUNSTDRAFT_118585 [Punctularia strigosozonata HHB-11173 SS5]EIN12933.1 hypothetical protein PUNSTDRAFT_118585 [Punctularia strigosozonata HHB-11173 SS5]
MKKVWGCPHCPFVQQNRRRPDLNRHINTHMRSNNWVCCGVPVAYAAEYGIGPTAKQVEFKGRMRVGGCFKTFSRRDALKRHVDNRSIGCIGDLSLHPSTGNIV